MTDNHAHTPNTARIKDDYRRSRVWESGNGSEAYEKEFDRWYQAEIAAAEQRGAIKALLKATDAIRRNQLPSGNEHTELCDNCAIAAADHLLDRADQIEGDDAA